MPRFHFIAIGGSAMHNLALTLLDKGYTVTGSDDEIYEPSRSRLERAGLLPDKLGWYPERITPGLDGIILGKHARADNPELLRARELGLPVYSYPEFIYEQSRDKRRVVIGGSHGKTTTTAILLHGLVRNGRQPDFMVGSQLKGFDRMIRLTNSADTIVLEGDEYPTSPLDDRPKFFHYRPHIAVLTGIALDHINVFKTPENYAAQFRRFITDYIEPGGTLIYNAEDPVLRDLARLRPDLKVIPYRTPDYRVDDRRFILQHDGREYPLRIFGRHNMQNLAAAATAAQELGIEPKDFYRAVQDFEGASLRLEKIFDNGRCVIYRDFAHAPSKVRASVQAVRELYPHRRLKAVLELHTYSSLSKEFIPNYRGSLDAADRAAVFYSPHAVAIKRLQPVEPEFIRQSFGKEGLQVFNDPAVFKEYVYGLPEPGSVILLMSSGALGGLDIDKLKQQCDS